MYTTLEILKSANACVPGYGRMLSFFTTAKKYKEVPIPIWMVGFIGDESDMLWAVENALVTDPVQWKKLRERTLLPLMKCRFWTEYRSHWAKEKNPRLQDAIASCMRLQTYEEAEAWLDKWRVYHFNHVLWSDIVENYTFSTPYVYLRSLYENQERSVGSRITSIIPSLSTEDKFFPWDNKKSKLENFASLFTDKPYDLLMDYMMETKIGAKRGIQINRFQEGDTTKYAATFSVSSPKLIFQASRLLNSQDLNILEITGVNELLDRVSHTISNCNNAQDLDSADISRLHRMLDDSQATEDAASETPRAATALPEDDLEEDTTSSVGRRAVSVRTRHVPRYDHAVSSNGNDDDDEEEDS